MPTQARGSGVHAASTMGHVRMAARAHRSATLMPMGANAGAADPRHALPESANQLQRAAAALREHASNAEQVPTLPGTLAHVHDTLDLLAVSIQRMAQAVADWCGADGRNVDDDAASPEARALRWHLGTTAEALRDSRDACSASAQWARRLLAEPLVRDARAPRLDRPERAPSRAVRRVGRTVAAAASRQPQNVEIG